MALASAWAALYGALCVVPSILVAVSVAQLVLGKEGVHRYGNDLAQALPSAIGADAAVGRLLDAGVRLTPLGVAIAIVCGLAKRSAGPPAVTRRGRRSVVLSLIGGWEKSGRRS